MCGIYGIVSPSLSDQQIRKRLDTMGQLQRHRGPDDKKEVVFSINDRHLGFGFVRLSILDLETGMQPIVCEKDRSAIICNGQIYNYIELKSELRNEPFRSKGDVEVALHLYRKKGLDFLQHLNGMYAGAIFDPVKSRLILFRDRFGIKPLYYTEYNGNLVFSSEIKPLLAGSGLSVQLNRERLATFFTYRYLPGEETMFRNIKRLPPGYYLEYDLRNGQYKIERYWEYRLDGEISSLDLNESAEKFMELFKDAVRIRLRSDVEVGCLLSGGIDSSAVSSQAVEFKPDLKLFTVAFDEEMYNELPRVQRFLRANEKRFGKADLHASFCGKEALNQLPEIVRAIEEPVSLGTILPTDRVCQMTGEHLKVVLTGEGADEIFGGYRKFLVEMAAHRYNRSSAGRQKELLEIYPELYAYLAVRSNDPVKRYIQSESLFTENELEHLIGSESRSDLFPKDAVPALSGREHPLNAAIAMEARSRLPDYVILRLDKLSMRHSIETRTPLLDFRLAEFAATLPVHFKVNLDMGREKYLCSHAYFQHSLLDQETAGRKKQPFTIPMSDWLADPASLPDFLQEILLGDFVEKQGILNNSVLKKLVSSISSKGVGPDTLVSEADRLFAIMIFSLWYNEFFNAKRN